MSDPFCLLYTCSYYCYLRAYSVFKTNLVWDYHILLLLVFLCVCVWMSFHTCFWSKSCLSGTKHSSRFMSDIELRSYGCKYASMFSLSIMSKSLQPHGLYLARVLCSRDFPGKNSGVGCHFPWQGIYPIWGLNPCLMNWQRDSLALSHLGSSVGTNTDHNCRNPQRYMPPLWQKVKN